jgi:glycosyltransferase involved in cell wall biosynthesis
MKIIYAYELDATEINTQSGRPFSILRQLQQRACEVVRAFPLRQHVRYLYAWKYLHHRMRRRIYRPDREPLLLRSLARQIERRVRGIAADALCAPGSHAIAELDVPHPKILVADATFANVLEFYGSFTNCAPEFIEQEHEQDRKALANCAAAIYPTGWAARSAIERYGASPDKIHVIPFGAKIEAPDSATVRYWIGARRSDELRLLFIGRDWYRKGGEVVLATCEVLRRRRIPLQLDLVGLPRVPVALPPYARSHGLLDRKQPDQRRRLEDLFARAHFLFVPSLAENYGMVFSEAAAFGVPSVTTNVGGIPTIVRQNQTGFTLPRLSAPEAFANALEAAFAAPQHYQELALAARADYRTRLNWDAFGARFMEVAEQARIRTI